MNLPNKLTLSRLLAVVVITALYFILGPTEVCLYIILGLFILASFTDFLDGKIARKYNMVTGFGKLMDPLADKLLVVTAIIILMDLKIIPYLWMLIIVLAREFFVLGIRLVALESNGNVIAAAMTGKLKTMTQMVSLAILLFYAAISINNTNTFIDVIKWIGLILFYISMLLLVISGTEVFIKNKKYFKAK